MLLAQTTQNQSWLIGGAAVALGIYLLVRLMGKKKKDPLADTPVRFSLSQQKSVEREMQHLLVELSNMSRQITAQLDTRSAKLEVLLREADEKIARLQALNGDGDGDGRPAETFRLPMSSRELIDEDPRHAAVYQLADQGKSSQQIAAELGKPNGEVELILALRGKRE